MVLALCLAVLSLTKKSMPLGIAAIFLFFLAVLSLAKH
jgi:hypothetical protein